MKYSIAAVIVLVPKHLRFLKGLLENLNAAKPPFDHILIVASGFSGRRRVLRIATSARAAKVSVYFSDLGSAGMNRNIAWDIVREDIICFLDGDDLYAPQRNSIILRVFEETQCDLFLHSFGEFSGSASSPEEWDQEAFSSSQDLIFSGQLRAQPDRNREAELRGETSSTNLVFAEPKQEFPLQHAHVTVLSKMGDNVRFHEVFGVRNEDGVFAQDVLEFGGKIVVSPKQLSLYRQGARAKPSLRGLNLVSTFFRPKRQPRLVEVRGVEEPTS